MKKFTDDEIKEFISRTNEELILQDPLPVLQDLGIDYKELGNDSYRMNVRNEKTPSAYISLKNGYWKYRDFGANKGGNIVNVVMDYTGKPYKEALGYSLQVLGVKNHLDEALSSQQKDFKLSQTDKERLATQREHNKTKESSHTLSSITSVYEVSTNPLAVDYLKSRGIEKIPPHFKIISGQYENKQGELKKVFGVGVLTKDGKGADIHFLQKLGDLKTMAFGEKNISFFKNPISSKVAIFESKMDYAAAYQQMPLDDVNVIIANSTSNALKVSELLVKEGLDKSVMIFNQNDLSGYKFVADVLEKANIQECKSISYSVMSEYKKDINDLLLQGEKIADRIELRDISYFKDIAESLDAIQKIQQRPTVTVTREDLQRADKAHHSMLQEQER